MSPGRDTVPLFRCTSCAVRAAGICRSMQTPDELRDLSAARSGLKTMTAGQQLFAQGEANSDIYTVMSGWLFTYQLLEDGRRQILRFLMPGDMVGSAFMEADIMDYGVEALTDSSLCILPQSRVENLRRRYPHFGEQIFAEIESSTRQAMQHLTSIGRRTAIERIAYLLAEWFFRLHSDHRATVDLPLTQVVIADALGLTAVHVNRVLRSLREMDILSFRHGVLTILDSRKLYALIGNEEGFGPQDPGFGRRPISSVARQARPRPLPPARPDHTGHHARQPAQVPRAAYVGAAGE